MRRISRFLAVNCVLLAAAMLLPLAWAAASGDAGLEPLARSAAAAAAAAALLAVAGRGASLGDITPREAILAVALSWLVSSAVAAMPFAASRVTATPLDALFEGMSGVTTTGATVITDLDAAPRSVLVWRSFSQWIGGIGIVVLMLAFFPTAGAGWQLFKAEVTGIESERITPRMQETAKFLLKTYTALTAAFAALLLLVGRLSLFDALTLSFTTMSTGGFSPYADNVGHFGSAFVTLSTAAFLLLAASNLTFFHALVTRRRTEPLRHNPELRLYAAMTVLFGTIITLLLWRNGDGLADAAIDGFFHTASMISTCGYYTSDYAEWPGAVRHLMILMMLTGGCAISTSGGITCIRLAVILRHIRDEFGRMLHPRAVIPVRFQGRTVPTSMVTGCYAFMIAYIATFALGFTTLAFLGQDMTTAISSAAATLGNVGPGFGLAGPTAGYAAQSPAAKLVYMALMLMGRLEVFTPLLLFTKGYWK